MTATQKVRPAWSLPGSGATAMTRAMVAAVADGRLLPGMTVATSHAPFGFSRRANGGLLHRATRVVLVWKGGELSRVAAAWGCSPRFGSDDVELVPDPTGHEWCRRCEIDRDGGSRVPVVYLALCHDDDGPVVKVGRTRNLAARIDSLHAELVASMDGRHPSTERTVLAALAPYRIRGREWFSVACLPVAAEIFGSPLPEVAS
jgi:hypothetical protein